MFERLLASRMLTCAQLTSGLKSLFETMRAGGLFGVDAIPYFNGGLFETNSIPSLEVVDVTELRNAAAMNWSAIDVSIFGTLFERGLDPQKRSQLGAHYTDPATILRIVEPVISAPLQVAWAELRTQIAQHMVRSKKRGDRAHKTGQELFVTWLEGLRSYRILDPACGSGNFLYLGLKALKDVEHKSHIEAAAIGLDRQQDLVSGPQNVLGIELNEYAAELARVTVWIGELQWRIEHGYELRTNPVLEPLEHIQCRDAIIAVDLSTGVATEAEWPAASVIVGNPPFLGDKRMRKELGNEYTDAIRLVYRGRVPGGADLVCYWFQKAGEQIRNHGLGAAGLVATNVISRGANRNVLDQIAQVTSIFEVWDDQTWVNEGAAVRVSLVCFGNSTQQPRVNGEEVQRIYPDLTGATAADSTDFTTITKLTRNQNATYFGVCLAGPFKVDASIAATWLNAPNPHGRPNSDVVLPIRNGTSLTERMDNTWVVDFGAELSEADAALYELPFAYARAHVYPVRAANNRAARAASWWRHGEARPGLRQQLRGLPRYIATVETSKHRFFVFMPTSVDPEHSLIVIPRADDVTFGLLESRMHFLWTMRLGSPYGNHPTARRYNASRVFETFPFPEGLAPQDTRTTELITVDGGALIPSTLTGASRAHGAAIALAARQLDTLRNRWLNPPEWTESVGAPVPLGAAASPYPPMMVARPGFAQQLQARTLTKLYNERPTWLEDAHRELDYAVAAAYGWADYSAGTSDIDVLRMLHEQNALQAAGQED